MTNNEIFNWQVLPKLVYINTLCCPILQTTCYTIAWVAFFLNTCILKLGMWSNYLPTNTPYHLITWISMNPGREQETILYYAPHFSVYTSLCIFCGAVVGDSCRICTEHMSIPKNQNYCFHLFYHFFLHTGIYWDLQNVYNTKSCPILFSMLAVHSIATCVKLINEISLSFLSVQ